MQNFRFGCIYLKQFHDKIWRHCQNLIWIMSEIWHRLIEYRSKYLLTPDIWWQNYVMGKNNQKNNNQIDPSPACCHPSLCLNQFSVMSPDAWMTVFWRVRMRNLWLHENLVPAFWHKYHQDQVKTLSSPPLQPQQTDTWLPLPWCRQLCQAFVSK